MACEVGFRAASVPVAPLVPGVWKSGVFRDYSAHAEVTYFFPWVQLLSNLGWVAQV